MHFASFSWFIQISNLVVVYTVLHREMMMKTFIRSHGFTLIELLVVITIIAILIAVLLPAMSSATKQARKLQGATQMRGIQQGMLASSQENKGFYPGAVRVAELSRDAFIHESEIEMYSGGGQLAGSHVTARWTLLYEDDFISPDFGFSPGETEPQKLTPFDPYAPPGTYTRDQYLTSFALPQLIVNSAGTLTAEGRLREWSNNAGSDAVVVSDRMTGGINRQVNTHTSIWNGEPGKWEGVVTFNDNHVEFFNSSEIERTEYGSVSNNLPDNLFADNPPGERNAVNHANAKQIMRWRSGHIIR